jgi:hypothetical protein
MTRNAQAPAGPPRALHRPPAGALMPADGAAGRAALARGLAHCLAHTRLQAAPLLAAGWRHTPVGTPSGIPTLARRSGRRMLAR